MKCLVCNNEIKVGEQIFAGSQVECCGNGEMDYAWSDSCNCLTGAIHLLCIQSLTELATIRNRPDTECVVRSDAMSLFAETE